jgi:exopolyphosphatase/guanosine-5'-triphosphate,3'-diphosphate pyrophosphatase
MRRSEVRPVLAAIDVGTNAVRLEIARPLDDQSLELLHQERDPVRPGEGVFATGSLPPETADRLIATLRRYAALCRRFHAEVKAVATSAVREAKNRDEIVQRAREEAGIELEVVSGREEPRLICLGVLHGRPDDARALVVDIGGGSTEVAHALGERPQHLWSVGVGAVRLAEIFEASGKVSEKKLGLMRSFAEEAFREALPPPSRELPRAALGSSGTIQAVVAFAAAEGTAHATRGQVRKAVERLAAMSPDERRRRFDPKRAEIVVAGAVVLETVMEHLKLQSITAVDRGLRDGLLLDLLRRGAPATDASLTDAVLALGRRFDFDEAHATQVARLALQLFDDLARLHELPAAARPILEVAALLHDVGNAVSYRNHHKHSAYLVQHADLPGLTDHERSLAALVARYHRRSAPDRSHPGLAGVAAADYRLVRKLSTLLRTADSFDRSHQQPVRSIEVVERPRAVQVRLATREPVDLELWDLEREAPLFKRVFGKPLEPTTGAR